MMESSIISRPLLVFDSLNFILNEYSPFPLLFFKFSVLNLTPDISLNGVPLSVIVK